MAQVTGIGGIFFKGRDPVALRQWYKDMLGLNLAEWGGCAFQPVNPAEAPRDQSTIWNIFDPDTTYFAPSPAPFMINYRVDDLPAMLAKLRAAGATVDERMEESEFGKFGWVMDPEGNRLELWEPPAKCP